MFIDNPTGYTKALNYLVSIDKYSEFIDNKETPSTVYTWLENAHNNYNIEHLIGKVNQFKTILKDRGIEVSERYRRGADIQAACGQLVPEKI